jgi:hypothetical protein
VAAWSNLWAQRKRQQVAAVSERERERERDIARESAAPCSVSWLP